MSAGDSPTQTIASPQPPRPRGWEVWSHPARLQWLVSGIMIALIGLALARLWFLDGLLRKVTIDGPSMAPAFCGACYEVTCADCGISFRIDADHPPPSGNATCPNCGFGENPLDKALWRPRERVLIDRWQLLWRRPRRWEAVAARDSAHANEFIVKRVAAVAPEQLTIESGDLSAGDKLIRKSAAEFRKVRQLVHDNDYQPRHSPHLPPRWAPAKLHSAWQATGTGFQIAPAETGNGAIDWLEYQHWPCTANQQLRGVLAPVRDNDCYNQGEGPRELNAVFDIVLSCQVQISGQGQLAFAALDGDNRIIALLEPGKIIAIRMGDRTLMERPLNNSSLSNYVDIEFGICDQQVLLTIGLQTLISLPLERPVALPRETAHPLTIGVRGLAARIDHLRVWRDIYYLDPQSLPRPWRAASPLVPGEVALLGDNQPVSTDSRHWDSVGLPRHQILGCVYKPFWVSE